MTTQAARWERDGHRWTLRNATGRRLAEVYPDRRERWAACWVPHNATAEIVWDNWPTADLAQAVVEVDLYNAGYQDHVDTGSLQPGERSSWHYRRGWVIQYVSTANMLDLDVLDPDTIAFWGYDTRLGDVPIRNRELVGRAG